MERVWEPRLDALGGRTARRGFSYGAYVPAKIAEAGFPLESDIAAAAANAEVAVRELNGRPPEPANFEVLARQLLRAESVASSRIEGLVLSHRRLAKAAFSADLHDITAQSVLANIRALERAVDLAATVEGFEREHLLEIHRILLEGTRDEHLGGELRREQNWIGGAASSPHNAEFIPPPPGLVRELVDDLCEFCNRVDLPAAIQAAIAHVQFETIHPFVDGNGRVGRALILAVLRRRGVAQTYLPPVSLALAGNADRYVAGMTSWRLGEEEDWYEIFAEALFRSADGAREFGAWVLDLQRRWMEKAGHPRKGSGAQRLIDLLPSQPIIDVKTAARLLGGTEERARLAILRLEKSGVLHQITVGRRNRAWECVGLFDLLDRFERDLGPAGRTPRLTKAPSPSR
ncbi:MAG TPA: Fic family protein [Solirubrobacterales bacterium]|nr:Fic family protein [Solirubrobacterales bacterium]